MPRALRPGLLAAAAVAFAVLFHAGLLFGAGLHGFDWEQHWHYYDWIRTSLREYRTLPLFMADAWHTTSFLANAQTPLLGPAVGLLAVLGTTTYIRLLIVVYTALGTGGGYLLARDLGARPALAALASILYAGSGFFAAHVAVGHHWVLGAYLLPGLFLAVRRALAGSRGALAVAAALDALALLEGQHHPFLWQNALILLWGGFESMRLRELRPLRLTATVALVALGLAGVRAVPILLEFAHYKPLARIGGLPPQALPTSLLGPHQGPTTSGFGIVFLQGSGWWEYCFYVGALGALWLAVGSVAGARRQSALLGAGAVFGFFALDTSRFGFDVWHWLQQLPVADSQRAPSRLAVITLFAVCFAAAAGWERILRRVERSSAGTPERRSRTGRFIAALLAVWLVATAADLVHAARPWQAAASGPSPAPRPHMLGAPRLVGAAGEVHVLAEAPNRVEYQVRASRAALLVLPVALESRPQWHAGRLPVMVTPTGLEAVRVPAGEHRLVLTYRPRGLAAGIGTSVASVVGLLAWLRWRRRDEADPSASRSQGK